MSASKAIMEARAVGVNLGVDDDKIAPEASMPPPAAVRDALLRHKTEVVAREAIASSAYLAGLTQKQLAQEVGWDVDRAAAPEVEPRKPT